MVNKYVYSFKEADKDMKSLLGGKGANLGEMIKIGLPVPLGFTITTQACLEYFNQGEKLWDSLIEEVEENIERLEKEVGKKFSHEENPLLVSVRSGAVISMPGMMDTILNLGLNDKSVESLAKSTNSKKFAYDSYRRFIQMFSDVAMGIAKVRFDVALEDLKNEKNIKNDNELSGEDFEYLVGEFKKIYKDETGEDFPQSPIEQLKIAIEAVFKSWNNPRAKVYRSLNNIPDDLGTAVNIQTMVFGNMGEESGTGVAFTRNPATGENKLFGEYLIDAQGEDVVAGIRTPEPIEKLKEVKPEIYEEFEKACQILENHYKDMQDIEFTIENRKLYLLQTRSGKRTAQSAVKIAVDHYKEGLITKEEAVMRVDTEQLKHLLHPNFNEEALKNARLIGKGLAASPGAASGRIYFNAEDTVAAVARGEEAILVRQETSPEDIEGMVAAEGILTSRGGMTSHAAVVARGMGKCCVAGSNEMSVNEELKLIRIGDLELKEGDEISLDGSTGSVYLGLVEKEDTSLSGDFSEFMDLVDQVRELGVRANADNPKDILQALEFGAEGVGLTRTEHMFFDLDRLPSVRKMILAKTSEERKKALEELLPLQREDFYNLFMAVGGKPITIRLLDPPLHEFLPHTEEGVVELAKEMNIDLRDLKERIEGLEELNPMLGHRGCRLAISYPEIYNMQVRAIIEAAMKAEEDLGKTLVPEIMVPLVGEIKELEYVKSQILAEIEKVFEEKSRKIDYMVGTMIEIPRACLTADEIAKEAEFFSFGTNDLSQMSFGFSRDDAGKFLGEYLDKSILERDPFQAIDQKGVGKLMKMAVKLGKETRPNIKLGICGEHGGEPSSVKFCNEIGLDYVSCSPYRVPIAKLAAAQGLVEKNIK